MIGMRTILEVADNSGARRLQCILPRGGDLVRRKRLVGYIDDRFQDRSQNRVFTGLSFTGLRCIALRGAFLHHWRYVEFFHLLFSYILRRSRSSRARH